MKLTSLFIEDYKLLKNFSINFNKNVSILIGINGSGKSSILETIAQIFSDAFLNEKSKFGFNLAYELRLEEVIEQTATTSEFRTDYVGVEISASNKDEDLSFKVFVEEKVLENKEDIENYKNNLKKQISAKRESKLSVLKEQATQTIREKLKKEGIELGND